MQFSTAVKNARLDAIEATIGTSPIMRILSGSMPASCSVADSGTVLATITLPSDWMSAASGGSKSLLGNWEDTSADATGTAGYFRIYDSSATTCHLQGAFGTDGTIDNASIVSGQDVKVPTFTLTEPA